VTVQADNSILKHSILDRVVCPFITLY